MACRVVCNLQKYDHVTASMKSLHWLRVREHISYKIACLVHWCKVGTAPQYLIDLPMATHNCSLRSSTSGNLQSAKWRTSLAKEGSFSSAGPKIWNSILPDVWARKSRDSFRKSLKIFLGSHTLHRWPFASSSCILYFTSSFTAFRDVYSILEMVSPV